MHPIIVVHTKRSKHPNTINVGRPSVLGNKFSHLAHAKNTTKVDTVEQAVSQYKEWLLDTIPKSITVRDALNHIYFKALEAPVHLACWCKDETKPLASDHICHADVIRDVIQSKYEESLSKPKSIKVIIAGGRDFIDFQLLESVLLNHCDNDNLYSLVLGGAKGADYLGLKFAHDYNVHYQMFLADWDNHGKRAGFLRNEQMGNHADELIAFWDGESRGTKHMIDYMTNLGKPVTIIRY